MDATTENPSEILLGSDGDQMGIRLYRVHEIANAIGVHHRTIRRWIADGKIRLRRTPGGAPVATRQDILDMIEQMNEENHGQS